VVLLAIVVFCSAITVDKHAVDTAPGDRPAADSVAGKRVTAVVRMSSAAGNTEGFGMR
jgi:hypothetical protein